MSLATGTRLHLIQPLGFSLESRQLQRAGLDYWERVDLHVWENFAALQASAGVGARFHYFTTKASRPYWEARFEAGDYLVFGPESRGLPESLLNSVAAESRLRIPMRADSTRSLNLATSVGIALYEGLRQLEFAES